MADENTEEQGLFIEDLIVRRTELDDAHTLSEIITAEESSNLELLYNYPKVLRLIETSCLSVTVLDKQERILGCLVFDAATEIITGLNDFQHENLWEDWLYSAFHIDSHLSITPYNSLWLKYLFVANGAEHMTEELQIQIVEKTFKFVYNTLPELQFILFHLRVEAARSKSAYSFIRPVLDDIFFALERKDLPPDARENMNMSSQVFVSDRSRIIQILEIREALEQDHDDLVEICNAQSELYTQVYGDYFIAELIANQTEDRKAIVAQVENKAKGLLSLSTDIDYGFLSKNFELEVYDNLCSYEFMDALRFKRREAEVEREIEEERKNRQFQRKMHDLKILCSEVANRMMLQQFCIERRELIITQMQEAITSEQHRIENKRSMEERINEWLKSFSIEQPKEFFVEHPIIDVDLYGHVINEKELFLDTLTFFGLEKGYIDGNGQWKDYQKNLEEKRKLAEKKEKFIKGGNLKTGKRRGKEDQNKDSKPHFFDIQPLLDAFKNFVDIGADSRSKIRKQLAEERKKITQLFCNDNGEPDETKRQDILEIAEKLNTDLQPNQLEGFGWVLECFGNCKYLAGTKEVEEKAKDDGEEAKLRKKLKQNKNVVEKKIIKVTKLANFVEFQSAVERLNELDETLMRLGKLQSPLLKETVEEKEADLQKNFEKKIEEKRRQIGVFNNPYTENPEFKRMTEEEIMKNVPQEARNAVAVNIFFIDKQFESRSVDFLNFAFEMFPNVEYIILTQPFRVEESVLLQSFIPVGRRENTNISHTLYIYHRACLGSPFLTVRKSTKEDVEQGDYLLEGASNEKEFKADLIDAITNNASNKISFSAFNQNAVIGFFVMTKDVNLEYYKSHFCIQYHLILDQYSLTDHSRLLHSVVNPLFQRSRRYLFREILRLSNKSTLLFEVISFH
jgi:hypothetical protein